MHKLLQRQLKRHAQVDSLDAVPEPWRTLLGAVSAAYDDADDDHRLIERSLEISSQELLSANLELRAISEELGRSNADLAQFAYIASHDLREPLRMIASYLQLLARRYRKQLDGDANEYIDYAVDGAKRMQRMIDDLLAFSRVDRKGQAFEATDLTAVLNRVCLDLRMAIEEAQGSIVTDSLPTVLGDPMQIGLVWQNLIGNALKFRGDKAARIEISATAREQEWLFQVKDHGIGFDLEYAERIFTLFQRLHTEAEYPGTGLGLAICKKVVERHGGQIWAQATPGSGATFFFTLPMHETTDKTDRQTQDSTASIN